MITIQVVPRGGRDAYKLLRDKVTHEAQTWQWANRAKTRLQHINWDTGYIEVSSADNVLNAQIQAKGSDPFFLVEKFVGRLVAWFGNELIAINLQFIPDERDRAR
jgi:hypothetical protein